MRTPLGFNAQSLSFIFVPAVDTMAPRVDVDTLLKLSVALQHELQPLSLAHSSGTSRNRSNEQKSEAIWKSLRKEKRDRRGEEREMDRVCSGCEVVVLEEY